MAGGFQPIAFQPAYQQEAALEQNTDTDENRRRRWVIRKVSRETLIDRVERSTGVRKRRRDTLI